MNKVIINQHDFKDHEFALHQGVTTLGRASDNMIHLPDPAISSHHARIVTIFDASYIEDLGSTNGTRLNGRKVQRHPLRHGDILSLGKIQLVFVNEAAAKKAAAERPRAARTVSDTGNPATSVTFDPSRQEAVVRTMDSMHARTKPENMHHPVSGDFEHPGITRSTVESDLEIGLENDEGPEEITLRDIPTLDEALPLSQMRMKLSQAQVTRRPGSRPQKSALVSGFAPAETANVLSTVSGSRAGDDEVSVAVPPLHADMPDSPATTAIRSFLSGWKIWLAAFSLLGIVAVILFLALWDIPFL